MEQDVQVSTLKELMRQRDKGENIDAGVQYRMPISAWSCSVVLGNAIRCHKNPVQSVINEW